MTLVKGVSACPKPRAADPASSLASSMWTAFHAARPPSSRSSEPRPSRAGSKRLIIRALRGASLAEGATRVKKLSRRCALSGVTERITPETRVCAEVRPSDGVTAISDADAALSSTGSVSQSCRVLRRDAAACVRPSRFTCSPLLMCSSTAAASSVDELDERTKSGMQIAPIATASLKRPSVRPFHIHRSKQTIQKYPRKPTVTNLITFLKWDKRGKYRSS
jgi:hypothetical protein